MICQRQPSQEPIFNWFSSTELIDCSPAWAGSDWRLLNERREERGERREERGLAQTKPWDMINTIRPDNTCPAQGPGAMMDAELWAAAKIKLNPVRYPAITDFSQINWMFFFLICIVFQSFDSSDQSWSDGNHDLVTALLALKNTRPIQAIIKHINHHHSVASSGCI